MIRFRNLTVRRKLAVTFLATVVPLLAAGVVSVVSLQRALRNGAEVELANVVDHLYRVCDAQLRLQAGAAPGARRPTEGDVAFVRAVMGTMKVGQTGYPYCMDTRGNLIVHPTKEGQNILESRDSQGFPFIRELCRQARRLGPGEVGTFRYPWRNEEVGETAARVKLLRFRYFQPWDWVISAGSYEDEVYGAVVRLRLYTAPLVAASLALVALLTVAMNRLFTRPLVRLSAAAAAMEAGDGSALVEVGPARDEFGLLGHAFNAMAARVGEKTQERERLIEERTQALAESRERYRSLVQSSADGIVTTDRNGVVTFVNHGLEGLLGLAKDDIVGREIWCFYPEGKERARAIMALLREHGSLANYEMAMVGKGRVVPIRTSASILRDKAGTEQGTLGIFSDLTAEKKLQADLKKTQAQLVQTMKLRALGDLVSGVAHEVNNPLMASITMVHLMEGARCPDGCPNRGRLGVVKRCNDRIAAIVDHLKEFSRQTHWEKKNLDVNAVVESALSLVGQQLLNHEIEVRQELAAGLPEVFGEPNALEQVLLNLIGNARDALNDVAGGRVLELRTAAATFAGAPAVRVDVGDNGPGIPEEARDKLFEPFFTLKEVGKGTGLGLSISYGIVEEHGGALEAEDRPGGGALFRVTLPAVGPRA